MNRFALSLFAAIVAGIATFVTVTVVSAKFNGFGDFSMMFAIGHGLIAGFVVALLAFVITLVLIELYR